MNLFKTAAIAATVLIGVTAPAAAKCTRLGFSVNDYGKDGPIKDAKQLLDQYIAKWAAEHKIAKYTVGKKDVKCDLFLDVIVFDEHTCRAEASVCWTEAPGQIPYNGPAGGTSATKSDAPAGEKKAKPAGAKAAAKSAPAETGAISPAAGPSPAKAATPKAATPADKAAAAADLAAAAAERAAAAAAAAEKAAAAAAAKATAPAPVAPPAPPAAAPAAAPAVVAPAVVAPPKPAQ